MSKLQNNTTNMKGFFSYFIGSYRVTFLVIGALIIFGTTTAVSLPRESAPEIKVPIAVVVTAYPGASARDVEELVTNEVEDKVANVEGLKKVTSTSQLGVSTVTAEFFAEEDQQESLRRLREAVDTVTDLPEDATDPRVIEISFDGSPILSISLSGINDTRLLSAYAKEVADKVESIPNISSVAIVGERTEEIGVVVKPQQLERYGVSIGQIVGVLKANNINAPVGRVETDGFGYEVRLVGRYGSISDIAELNIATPTATVPLKELADIKLRLNETSSSSRVSVNGNPSTSAVTLQVYKKTGGNIIDIVDTVEAEIEAIKSSDFPAEIAITSFADQAEEIRTSLSNVTQSGLQTLVIVFTILWLFLGWREAVIASLAVPFTFFIAFIIFKLTGTTFNGISLFSLILALGLLVDNAIVITEGIYSDRKGKDIDEHASSIVQQFQKPLASGTLTTVAAFAPMLLVSGVIGQFLRTIPIVVSATLLSSLLVALAFLPAVATRVLRYDTGEEKER